MGSAEAFKRELKHGSLETVLVDFLGLFKILVFYHNLGLY